MGAAGGRAAPAALRRAAGCALLLLCLGYTQASALSVAEEVAEGAYWRARSAAAQVWRRRTPGDPADRDTRLRLDGQDRAHVRIWDIWGPDYHCPHVRERVGRVGDGGKWLCGVASLLQRPGCVAFALGSDGDTSFEEALLNRTRCEVHTFDHTLNATEQAAVRRVAGVRLHDTGLAAEPAAAGATLQTLPAMMAGLQVAWLDVLKVDVEGAEWRALAHWYHSGLGTLPVGQLLVEFHAEHASGGVEGTIAPLLQMLADDGYRVFSTEPNTYCETCSHASLMEYSFIKVARSGHVYGAGGHMHAGARKRRTEA